MEIELIPGIYATVLIIVIIQGLKSVGMPIKLAPLAGILLGVIISFGFALYGDTEIWEWLLRGVGVGLTSVGLYSGVKNVKEYTTKDI